MGILIERLEIDGIAVEVRRNRRRKTRIAFAFDPAGFVVLDVPVDAEECELAEVIRVNRRWLREQLARTAAEEQLCLAEPEYASGDRVQYLGDAYTLRVSRGRSRVEKLDSNAQLRLFADVDRVHGEVHVHSPDPQPSRIKRLLRRWYGQEGHRIFAERLARWRHLPWLEGSVPPFRTSFMRSQWGSCSASGRIALNTHLIKTPRRVIDYVVLHELCHLEEANHGRRFQRLMSTHMPDWETRCGDLERYQSVLLQE